MYENRTKLFNIFIEIRKKKKTNHFYRHTWQARGVPSDRNRCVSRLFPMLCLKESGQSARSEASRRCFCLDNRRVEGSQPGLVRWVGTKSAGTEICTKRKKAQRSGRPRSKERLCVAWHLSRALPHADAPRCYQECRRRAQGEKGKAGRTF